MGNGLRRLLVPAFEVYSAKAASIFQHTLFAVAGWKCSAEKAGLPKLVNPETGRARNISPHRLRDTFAVHTMKLDDSGDGLRFLQEHLGHVSFNTTAKYRKVAGEELKDWYDKLWEKEVNPDAT